MATQEITNTQDIIDSRDVIARIAELEDERDALETVDELEGFNESDSGMELQALQALADEADDSPDWRHGEALIRDSYFEEYARELAEDIGAVDRNATWPNQFIDWEAAADALKQDYMSVDFDGVEYWIRA